MASRKQKPKEIGFFLFKEKGHVVESRFPGRTKSGELNLKAIEDKYVCCSIEGETVWYYPDGTVREGSTIGHATPSLGLPAAKPLTESGKDLASESCPVKPDDYPWRHALAIWPEQWRQTWGEAANGLAFSGDGLVWWRAEIKAFLAVVGLRNQAKDALEVKTIAAVEELKRMFPKKKEVVNAT